jgi:hypothetical protein
MGHDGRCDGFDMIAIDQPTFISGRITQTTGENVLQTLKITDEKVEGK